jgi:hypothetical protein
MRKGPGSAYDKWNISVIIYELHRIQEAEKQLLSDLKEKSA